MSLPLWSRFTDEASLDNAAKVGRLLNSASALLDRVVETFPTYTLHSSRHALNVAFLMGELLGDTGIAKLTPLEAAMLLLSAYYHDSGMVFRLEERETLSDEPEWEDFLRRFPEAFLAVDNDPQIPIEIAESFCRWRHADRVFVYLNALPIDDLKWGAVSFKEDLGR